jgi:hypothetical protein
MGHISLEQRASLNPHYILFPKLEVLTISMALASRVVTHGASYLLTSGTWSIHRHVLGRTFPPTSPSGVAGMLENC